MLYTMQILKSELFNKYPELIFSLSTKIGLNRTAPFYFNLSLTVGDDPKIVKQNRELFFQAIGLTTSQIAFQRQIHSDIITIIEKPGLIGTSDAMITSKRGIGLAISAADCTAIFIYDKRNSTIAAVHSGWRGTQKKILGKTLLKLALDNNSKPEDLLVYVGPSISQKKYEVGKKVAKLFDKKYLHEKENRFYLNVTAANVDMLFEFGITANQIEISELCTYEEKNLLYSYRRDGELSGRALGIIAFKGE